VSDTFRVKVTDALSGREDFWLDVNVFEPQQGLPLGINVELRSDKRVTLDLLDIAGYRVTRLYQGNFNAGRNRREWNGQTESGQPVGSGVYIITMLSEDRTVKGWKKVIIRR
jgi:flagellar hook assembly protein FlgD